MPQVKTTVGYLHTINGNLGRFDAGQVREATGQGGFDPKLVPDLPTLYQQRRASEISRKAKGLPPVRYGHKRIVGEAA